MDTPTYNQYCLQSLDASNTFQHSEALFTENEARENVVEIFKSIINENGAAQVTNPGKYTFYRGIKAKKLSGFASTTDAELLGLFGKSITSDDLCFVYTYDGIYVVKMINKKEKSKYINENEYNKLNRIKEENITNNLGSCIELNNVENIYKSIKIGYGTTVVQVELDQLLCLQSALYVNEYTDFVKGCIFLNCLKHWTNEQKYYVRRNSEMYIEIFKNILKLCLTKKNNIDCIQIYDESILPNTNKYNYDTTEELKKKEKAYIDVMVNNYIGNNLKIYERFYIQISIEDIYKKKQSCKSVTVITKNI